MLHHLQQFGAFGFDTGLFPQFAAQRLLRRFTLFDLATGELPESGHVRVGGAAGNKDLPLRITDDAHGDIQMFHLTLLMGVKNRGSAS